MKPEYIVVEMAGMEGERDVFTARTRHRAEKWLDTHYTRAERDRTSPECLYPAVCIEIAGVRNYEVL